MDGVKKHLLEWLGAVFFILFLLGFSMCSSILSTSKSLKWLEQQNYEKSILRKKLHSFRLLHKY